MVAGEHAEATGVLRQCFGDTEFGREVGDRLECRVAVGGVAPKPWRVEAAEALLPKGAKAVSERLLEGATPTDDNQCKLPLVERTLASVLAQARETA